MTQVWQRSGYSQIMYRLLCSVLACLLFLAGYSASAAQEFPVLQGDIYAQDYTGTLTRDEIASLDALGRRIEDKTGAQVVVAIVQDVPNGDMQTYATDLFRHWGIGAKAENNGVLLLVAPSERQVRIEVGYGLEGAINDARAGEVLDNYFIPAMKEGNANEAVMRTYGALAALTIREYGLTAEDLNKPGKVEKPVRQANGFGSYWLWALLAVLAFLDVRFNRGRILWVLLYLFSRGGGGGGGGSFGGGGGGFRGGGGGSSGGGGAGRSW